MRGREILDDIQQFLDTVIIRCFTLKYTLLPKRREAITPSDLDLWSLYKSQEEYFKGENEKSLIIPPYCNIFNPNSFRTYF